MNISKYDAEADCPKCGFIGELRTEYCSGTYTSQEITTNGVFQAIPGHVCSFGLIDEHLHRVCTRCSHVFPQRALDDDRKGGMQTVELNVEKVEVPKP